MDIETVNNLDVESENSENVSSPIVVWVDITEKFKEACKQLKLGELMHDNKFSLVEGMSAIEMMEPKMDAGMIVNQDKPPFRTFQQAVQEGLVKVNNFSTEEFIHIIDDSFSCYVSWLEGMSLAQTVFINIYLHDPELIDYPNLKYFSDIFLKIVSTTKKIIIKAGVFEEEDFQPSGYNFTIETKIEAYQSLAKLKDLEETLSKFIKNTKTKDSQESGKEFENSVKILSRLRVTRSFYTLVSQLFNDKLTDNLDSVEKLLKNLKENLNSILKSIEEYPSLKPDNHIQITNPLTESINTKTHATTNIKNDASNTNINPRTFAKGFYPSINQRLLPPTFPRLISIGSRAQSYRYLDLLVHRIQKLIEVVHSKHFLEIFEFCLNFSASGPCLFSRSLLQLVVLPPNKKIFGKIPIQEAIKNTIRAFSAPPVLNPRCSLYKNNQAKDFLEVFVMQSLRPFLFLLQTTGHNRARQRERWAKLLLDLSYLQDESVKLDSLLHQLLIKQDPHAKITENFGTFVLYLSLLSMILFLLSGFELELYAIHEYHYIFWYLSEGLYKWMRTTVVKADSFLNEAEVSDGKVNKKNKKTRKKSQTGKPTSNSGYLYQAFHHLSSGYYKYLIGLSMEGKLKQPLEYFDNEEVRFRQRFAPFLAVTTLPLLTYSDFKMLTDTSSFNPPIKPSDLYKSASEAFNLAKICFENINKNVEDKKFSSLIMVAKTNLIVMNILQRNNPNYSQLTPEFSFEHSKNFPTLKLQH